MMEAASTSKMSVHFCQTTRRNNPEDSHLHTRLKFQFRFGSYSVTITSLSYSLFTFFQFLNYWNPRSINICQYNSQREVKL
jgi:hypothetical protein